MQPEDHHRKKAWKVDQKAAAEAELPCSKADLRELFDQLEKALADHGCDHTAKHTRSWADNHKLQAGSLLDWARKYGGYCDCEVLANVPASNPALDE